MKIINTDEKNIKGPCNHWCQYSGRIRVKLDYQKIEVLSVFRCPKCSHLYCSSNLLENGYVIKTSDQKKITNFYTSPMKQMKECKKFDGFLLRQQGQKIVYYTENVWRERKLEAYIYSDKTPISDKCMFCDGKIIELMHKVYEKQTNIDRTLIGGKCNSCGENYFKFKDYYNYQQEFRVTNKDAVRFFIMEKVEKERIKRQKEIKEENVQIFQQEIYVYYKLNNVCTQKRHQTESVTLEVTNLRNNDPIKVNVYHCKECQKYFINHEMLQGYFDRGIYPLFKYHIGENSWTKMREVSKLMLYGYSVKEGVWSEEQRHNILGTLIDQNVMTKQEMILNIQSKVDYNGKKAGNENAKNKWLADIKFISQYDTSKQTMINGRLVRK